MFNFGFKRRNNNGPPKQGLLFRAKAPNSDNVLNDESTATLETLLDAGYALPTSVFAAVGTGAWFSDATTPITRLMSDILADPTINQYHIGASVRGGVWIFDPYTVWDSTIVKSQRYAKQTTFYSSTPTAYFNGVSIAGSTSFDSGLLGTNPGQWVFGNQGLPGDPMMLVNAGVDVPAIEGARLEWVEGPELVVNGRFDTNLFGWTIAAGTPVWSAGVVALNTGGDDFRQTFSTEVGKTYQLVYSASGPGASASFLNIGTTSGANNIVNAYMGAGVALTRTFVATTTSTTLRFFASALGVDLDNISIKSITPTWRTTYTDGTPILPTTTQPTRTSTTVLDGSELGPELWTIAKTNAGITANGDGSYTFAGYTGWFEFPTLVLSSLTGKTIKQSLTITDYVSGFVKQELGTPDTGHPNLIANGTYTGTSLVDVTHSDNLVWISAFFGKLSAISVKQVLPAFTSTFLPSTTYAAYDRSNPLLMPGMLSEPARTNKVTCRKANPVDTTGLTKSGDAASVLSVVDDTAALTAAGLIGVCSLGKVYKLDNSLGSTTAIASISGASGVASAHTISCYVRCPVGSGLLSDNFALTQAFANNQNYSRAIMLTSVNATVTFGIRAVAGAVVYFILPQLEEGPFCTSPICKLQDGTDPLTALTRAGTVSSWPTLGKIRSNNMAFLFTYIPKAVGDVGVLFSTTQGTYDKVQLYYAGSSLIFEMYTANVASNIDLPSPNILNVPTRILITKTSGKGTALTYSRFETGAWGAWSTALTNTTDGAKGIMKLGSTYYLGSTSAGSQMTGNISELDTLLIPSNITDPLAWAKAQWGIA